MTEPRLTLPESDSVPVLESSLPGRPSWADFRAEVAAYDRAATVGQWSGPGHRMTYRALGTGPPLVLCPGLASTYRVYSLLLNRLAERFRTIQFEYPGDRPDDGARLGQITHEHLADDLLGLAAHLELGPVFLVGLSFGASVVLRVLHREPDRFPRAVLQGGFAHRPFSKSERLALALGRLVPGRVVRLPLHHTILTWKNRPEFLPAALDRWPYYVEQNGLTPIAPLAHRLDLLGGLDLRPALPAITAEVLLLHGSEDRIVSRQQFEELRQGLPRATGVLMPTVGHQPHFTHAETLANAIGDFLLPAPPTGRRALGAEPASTDGSSGLE